MTASPPEISVIVASVGRVDPGSAIEDAVRQSRGKPVEVILAGPEGTSCPEEAAGAVRIVTAPSSANLPALLGSALAEARGTVIAITDTTCRLRDGWIEAILEGGRRPDSIVGGAVEPEGLVTAVDWCAYFCDYGQFLPPLAPGAAGQIPGNNLFFPREALEAGRRFAAGEFWKTYWCEAARSAGHTVVSSPRMVVSYRKRFRFLPYMRHRFHNARCFAGMRNHEVSRARRLFYLAGSPVLPALAFWRILRTVASKGRHLGPFLRSVGVMVPAVCSWAAGEFTGYLLGPGGSCRHVR